MSWVKFWNITKNKILLNFDNLKPIFAPDCIATNYIHP